MKKLLKLVAIALAAMMSAGTGIQAMKHQKPEQSIEIDGHRITLKDIPVDSFDSFYRKPGTNRWYLDTKGAVKGFNVLRAYAKYLNAQNNQDQILEDNDAGFENLGDGNNVSLLNDNDNEEVLNSYIQDQEGLQKEEEERLLEYEKIQKDEEDHVMIYIQEFERDKNQMEEERVVGAKSKRNENEENNDDEQLSQVQRLDNNLDNNPVFQEILRNEVESQNEVVLEVENSVIVEENQENNGRDNDNQDNNEQPEIVIEQLNQDNNEQTKSYKVTLIVAGVTIAVVLIAADVYLNNGEVTYAVIEGAKNMTFSLWKGIQSIGQKLFEKTEEIIPQVPPCLKKYEACVKLGISRDNCLTPSLTGFSWACAVVRGLFLN